MGGSRIPWKFLLTRKPILSVGWYLKSSSVKWHEAVVKWFVWILNKSEDFPVCSVTQLLELPRSKRDVYVSVASGQRVVRS